MLSGKFVLLSSRLPRNHTHKFVACIFVAMPSAWTQCRLFGNKVCGRKLLPLGDFNRSQIKMAQIKKRIFYPKFIREG